MINHHVQLLIQHVLETEAIPALLDAGKSARCKAKTCRWLQPGLACSRSLGESSCLQLLTHSAGLPLYILQLGLVVKSLLDNLDSDWEEDNVPVADDNSNLFQLTSAVNPSAAEQDRVQDSNMQVMVAGLHGAAEMGPAWARPDGPALVYMPYRRVPLEAPSAALAGTRESSTVPQPRIKMRSARPRWAQLSPVWPPAACMLALISGSCVPAGDCCRCIGCWRSFEGAQHGTRPGGARLDSCASPVPSACA